MAQIDSQIDRLYQLPLAEFTPARNALAKELKQPEIKELDKPSVAAWAVNQLYWHERETWTTLTKASEGLRAAHRQLLAGKSADIRETERVHRSAVRDAIERIRQVLAGASQATTAATLTLVQETLEALPTADRPGRLTRPLKPLGFEALADTPIRPGLRLVDKPKRTDADAAAQEPGGEGTQTRQQLAEARHAAKQREKEERERAQKLLQAQQQLKAAEAEMLSAESAVKKAEKTLSELKAARDAAVSEYQRARLRAHG